MTVKIVQKKEKKAGETKFGGKKLKDYSKEELMELLQTFIKVGRSLM